MKNWRKEDPTFKGDYICRMANGYIKLCHWDTDEWNDMWTYGLEGEVKEWMNIPYDKN